MGIIAITRKNFGMQYLRIIDSSLHTMEVPSRQYVMSPTCMLIGASHMYELGHAVSMSW